MLYVKIMSDENMPDDDPHKGFKLITVGDRDYFCFENANAERHLLTVERFDGEVEEFELYGNAYVMNINGKTIQTCAKR